MKLLVITQKVDINDDILGFFHRWLEKFAEKFEQIIVICLQKGEYDLPGNVSVLSLGKEKYSQHSHAIRRLASLYRFYKYIWQERKNHDAVFVHMNPIYVVLGGLFWRIKGKKIALWYTHKQVDFKLRIAERLAHTIFTASRESCRLKSKKLVITGHGIDVNLFRLGPKREISKNFRILSVGRISPIKDYETLIRAVDILVNQKNIKNLEVKIIGRPVLYRDKDYFYKIKKLIKRKKLIKFINFIKGIPYEDLPYYYRKTDIFVNLCSTGGADKVVLEAMACEIPTLVCNRTFRKELGQYKKILFFKEKDAKDLVKRILKLRSTNQGEIGQFLRQQIIKHHNLDSLIGKLILQFKNLNKTGIKYIKK